MCTSVGHALGGLAANWCGDALPGAPLAPDGPAAARASVRLGALCAVLAAAPDLDLVFRVHRTWSHSLVAAALVSIITMAVTGKVNGRPAVRLGLICGAAWGSHLLLDWLAIDRHWPYGIQLLWPFSDRWFISGWDIFPQVERRAFLSAATMRFNLVTIGVELLYLLPVLAGLWGLRRRRQAQGSPAPTGR